MKRQFVSLLLLLFTTAGTVFGNDNRPRMSLAGTWMLALDNDSLFNDTISLPGTTDTNQKGILITDKSVTTRLSRQYSYEGKAWYKRIVDIPLSWKDKLIRLRLERTKPSSVYVDGMSIFSLKNITTPQVYHLDGYLTPGRHTLCIMVDNSVKMNADERYRQLPEQLFTSSHAFTEDTQTNWNGIIGDISLEAIDPLHVSGISVTPNISEKKVKLGLFISGELAPQTKIQVRAIPKGWNGKISFLDLTGKDFENTGEEFYEKTVDMYIHDMHLWSEFQPDLYTLEMEIEGHDLYATTFGMREMTADEHHFYINGQKTFLRSKHDACVFPKTAHVPMDVQSWLHYLSTCKEYGINHVRFHSWCPPEAAFQAADELGIYLQPELPFWGDFKAEDPLLMNCLKMEGERLITAYGNHPSFVMFALGNELWGSIDMMKGFVDNFRKTDSTKLYTFGSNFYLGYQGIKPGMDYFTTCRNGGEAWGNYNTHTRGSFSFADAADGGLINHSYPNTRMDFSEACNKATVPIISHETGQFQHIPDFNKEIPKYTGPLRPYNMEIFRKRMEKAGLLDQLSDFNRATGLWAVQLYKADIEMDLRTRNMAGFQLLDLQDYPGQGSAYVGILDAFMDNKGFISASEWREFCSPVVPLWVGDKYCYSEGEQLGGSIQIANYQGQSLKGKTVSVSLSNGKEVTMTIGSDETGLIEVGRLNIGIGQHQQPSKELLTVRINGTDYVNHYPVWIYPTKGKPVTTDRKLIVTKVITNDIAKKLRKGQKVLWMPDTTQLTSNTLDALFQTDYWNYRMFKTICENNKKSVSPGTMGILTDPSHPVFGSFPTEAHTNWQWFPVIKNSRPLILDNLPGNYRPLIQVIDNIERNHRLGILMEFKVGKGKLLLCMSDLEKASVYPEGRAFYQSLLNYMQSDAFHPDTEFALPDLLYLLNSKTEEGRLEELNNISPY